MMSLKDRKQSCENEKKTDPSPNMKTRKMQMRQMMNFLF